MRRALLLLLLLLAALPASGQGETRALWVTRYDYESAADVKRIVAQAADLGVNRLLFQVRGNASVFYPSALEPWSARLGGADPGFDPLALAVREAKARGIAIEAWINVMPIWRGEAPPENPQHPYLLHPEWVVVGSDGKPQRRTRHYVCANPARADVRAHVAGIAAEIAKGYAVDAVHLDYIRFVIDLERKLDFSHDPVSLKLFGKDPAKDPEAWEAFKAEQVTAVVADIRAAIHKARPTCRLTAAVFPTVVSRARVFQDVEDWVEQGVIDAIYPMTYADDDVEFARRLRESMPLGDGRVTAVVADIRAAVRKARPTCRLTAAVFPTVVSRARVFQDVEDWVEQGLIDAIYPMTYADDDVEFARRLRESLPLGDGRVPVYPGIAIRRHSDPAQSLGQIRSARAAGAKGFALFCYSAVFDSSDKRQLWEKNAGLRVRRAQALKELFRE